MLFPLTLALLSCTGTPDVASDDPGRVTARRLNRNEYDNTVRDLFATDLRPGRDFPYDDFGNGFDNQADTLSLAPLHLEMYELAADALVSELLAGTHPILPTILRLEAETDMTSDVGAAYGDAWCVWSNGALTADVETPSEGRYTLRARVYGNQVAPDPVKMSWVVDGLVVGTIDVEGSDPAVFETDLTLDYGGVHRIGVQFENDAYDAELMLDRNLWVDWVELEGPLDKLGETPPGFADVFVCDPATSGDERPCAAQILGAFAKRAWRRPVTPAELADELALYDFAVGSGAGFYEATGVGIKAILLSPRFIFRVEADPPAGETRALDAYEVATRLSYFLWCSTPDVRLLTLADDGTLLEDATLDAEIDRMLADPKAAALVDDFAGQWLYVRAVDDALPNSVQFPSFDEALRASMKEEMRRMIAGVLLADRPLPDLLTADTTWVDPRLATHYGFGRVGDWAEMPLEGTNRRGLLTTAGLLTALSYPTRTSPVKRGKWVLGNLLCEAPPPPPSTVNTNFIDTESEDPGSLKEQFEQHRADPMCASCHTLMDPIGFSMEHYDGIGAWRDTDNGDPLDTRGVLPDGRAFDDVLDLAGQLADDPKLARCAIQKTFTYALGRPPVPEDLAALDQIELAYGEGGERFSAIVHALAHSEPFRYKRAEVTP